MKDIVNPLAIQYAEIIISDIVNECVEGIVSKDKIEYENLINITTNNANVAYLQANTYYITKLKASISNKVYKALKQRENLEIYVEAGNLLPFAIFSNRGPKIKIMLDLVCYVNSEINGKFYAAGINQTRHSLILSVVTDAYITVFWSKTTTKVKTEFPLGETLITGDVPKYYGNGIGINTGETK